MIYGIGIDAEEVIRFEDWHNKSQKALERIFSIQEITYCLSTPTKSAERFAVRYAAREAFYKAYQSACYLHVQQVPSISFLNVCKHVMITKHGNGVPHCNVDWSTLQKGQAIQLPEKQLRVLLSLSHTRTVAYASVVIASRDESI